MTTPAQPATPRHARKRAAPAAAAKNRAARQAARQPKPIPSPKPKKPPATFAQQRAKARARSAAASRATLAAKAAGPTPEGAALYAAEKSGKAARTVARDVGQARVTPGDRRYQGIILAEFLIAVVVVAGLPVLSGGSPNAKAKGSPSPYDVGDLRQLVAIGGLYFVLALVSSGRHGRFAAWFGGLALIGLGFTKLDHIKALVPQKQAKGLGEQTAETAGGAVG